MEKVKKTTEYSGQEFINKFFYDASFRMNLDSPKSSGSYFFDSDDLFKHAKLKSVEIKNFKSIKHQKIEVKDLTLITGYNSSGKSAVSQFITMVIQWLSGLNASSEIDINGPLISLGTFSEIINRNAKDNESLTISFEFECTGERYSLFTKILTIEFTEEDLNRYEVDWDDSIRGVDSIDNRYYLKVKSFEKKIVITRDPVTNFSVIREQNILGEVPPWKQELGLFINKIIESKFSSSQIKKHNKESFYNREDVSSIEISYLYRHLGDKHKNHKDTSNILERRTIGYNFTNFLYEFIPDVNFPFSLTSLESNIDVFVNKNENPIDNFYLYQLFPSLRGSNQQNTSLLGEKSEELQNSVFVSGKSILKWRLYNELKLAFQGSNSTIPQLNFLNSLFEPALLRKQQSLDSNQKKQLSRFIKKFINIESLKFIDFDYLDKYKEDANNTNTDIYDNFIDKATNHLEKKDSILDDNSPRRPISYEIYDNYYGDDDFDFIPIPDDIINLRKELDILNTDIEKLLAKQKKSSYENVHSIDNELKELKRIRRNLKLKINRRENKFKKEFPMSKRSTLTEKERTLINEKDHQEEQKKFVLEIFKESINIDNGNSKIPFSFIESNSTFSKRNRENLNVAKRINSKPAFNIQDLIDGNFKEGLSYINKSLRNNGDIAKNKDEMSSNLSYKADLKRLKSVENEKYRLENMLKKLYGQNLRFLSHEHHNPNSKTEKFEYETLLEAKQAKGNLEQKIGENLFFYRCQKCYSFHIKTDFLPDGEKRKKTEKLREQKSLRYEEVQQEYENLKRKLRDNLNSENLEYLEYDLIEDINWWTKKIFSSEKNSESFKSFNFLFTEAFENSSKVLPKIVNLVDDETERLWNEFIAHYPSLEPDKEFNDLFKPELSQSLQRIFENIVRILNKDNDNDTFLTWTSIKTLNLLINSESSDSYNNFLYFLTKKEIDNKNKFKKSIKKLSENSDWRNLKSIFDDNDLVLAQFKYNFSEFIFTNDFLEDIQILRLKRPDNYETNKTSTKYTPVGITGDMTTSLLGAAIPVSYNGDATTSHRTNNLVFFQEFEDEELDTYSYDQTVLSQAIGEWLSYIFNTNASIETIRETKSETTVKFNDDFLHNVGSGVSQVLPVITTVLLSPGKTIFLEEIEQNLHASAQARLLDLLIVHTIKYGTKIIIETHSDHLINRLRLRKAQLSKISNDREFDWIVYFAELDNSKNTIFRNLLLDSNGMFAAEDIPKGFFDQPQLDILELLKSNSKEV